MQIKKYLLIEDNAIYLGNYTILNNQKYAGSFGDVSLLSFGIMKIIILFMGAHV